MSDQHSVFGASAPPWTVSVANDGIQVRLANVFYTGQSGWRVVGVRVWIPASAGPQTLTGHMWNNTSTLVGNTPSGSSDSTVCATETWTDMMLGTPVEVTAATPFMVGYTAPGNYMAVNTASVGSAAVQATDVSDLYLHDEAYPRGRFLYPTTGSNGNSAAWFGVDVLMDEGPDTAVSAWLYLDGVWNPVMLGG